jgi:hypothetical protein
MKLILSTVAALMLLGAVATQPAQAACWSNGYGWECWHPHPHWYGHPYWHNDWHHDWREHWHRGW